MRSALRVRFSGGAGIGSRPPYYLDEGETPIGRTLNGRGILLAEDQPVSRLHATVFLDQDQGQGNGQATSSAGKEALAESFFRAAHGGTLFLDEIGELPGPVLPRLLRALEKKTVLPVGGAPARPCDVRIVAATNRDSTAASETGGFRGDLFARLAEFTLAPPQLRDRREDLLMLAQRAFGDGAVAQLHPDLVERLLLHGWPYNVRELFNVLTERRIRAAGANPLTVEHLEGRLSPVEPQPLAASTSRTPALDDKPTEPGRGFSPAREKTREKPRGPIPTREELVELMRKHRNVIADVAREAGRSRAPVYRWLKQFDLARDGDDHGDD